MIHRYDLSYLSLSSCDTSLSFCIFTVNLRPFFLFPFFSLLPEKTTEMDKKRFSQTLALGLLGAFLLLVMTTFIPVTFYMENDSSMWSFIPLPLYPSPRFFHSRRALLSLLLP